MFKIMRVGLHRNAIREYDLSEAVAAVMDDDLNSDGELERMRERMDKQARFVGDLVEVLAQRKLLDADELGQLLGFRFTVETAPAECGKE